MLTPRIDEMEYLGTFQIHSDTMEGDGAGRVSNDPGAFDMASGLRQCCGKEKGFSLPLDKHYSAPGGYEIDCCWSSPDPADLLPSSGDPRIDWCNGIQEQVAMIRANAQQPVPKLARELGITKDRAAFLRCLARIGEHGYVVHLLLKDTGLQIEVPVPSSPELDALSVREDKTKVVSGRLIAVGGDEHGDLIFVEGHSRPLYVDEEDMDALHERRKQGTQVDGTWEKRDNRDYLVGGMFTTHPDQTRLPLPPY